MNISQWVKQHQNNFKNKIVPYTLEEFIEYWQDTLSSNSYVEFTITINLLYGKDIAEVNSVQRTVSNDKYNISLRLAHDVEAGFNMIVGDSEISIVPNTNIARQINSKVFIIDATIYPLATLRTAFKNSRVFNPIAVKNIYSIWQIEQEVINMYKILNFEKNDVVHYETNFYEKIPLIVPTTSKNISLDIKLEINRNILLSEDSSNKVRKLLMHSGEIQNKVKKFLLSKLNVKDFLVSINDIDIIYTIGNMDFFINVEVDITLGNAKATQKKLPNKKQETIEILKWLKKYGKTVTWEELYDKQNRLLSIAHDLHIYIYGQGFDPEAYELYNIIKLANIILSKLED